MRTVETIPGMWGGMMEGVNSTVIHCKNFCKYQNVPPAQQIIKNPM
jgi:hypothetical protein